MPRGIYAIEKRRGNRNAWKNGRSITGDGYVLVHIPADHPMAGPIRPGGRSARVYEHRVVMASTIGRPLERCEIVHHINGDRSDNRIENLMLFPNQRAHMAHHSEGG